MGRRIGIYGSSFDPVTFGHLWTANTVASRKKLDLVILVPTHSSSRYKDIQGSNIHRWNMLSLAVDEHNRNGEKLARFTPFEASDIEIKNSLGISNTYETMSYFKEKYPKDEIFFILGADILGDIVHPDIQRAWTKGKALIAENKFIVMGRDHYNTDRIIAKNPILRKYEDHFSTLDKGFAMEISSSYIREEIKYGGDPRHLLPDVCYQYIIDNKLYDYGKDAY